MSQSAEELRELLTRVVPQPPDSSADPVPLVAAGRAARRRRRATAVGSLAAAVVAAGIIAPVLVQRAPVAVPEAVFTSTQMYDDSPCPTAEPELADPQAVPHLDGADAIRLCTYAISFPGPALPNAAVASVADDALVTGFSDFASAAATLPAVDPARCAAVDYRLSDRTVLQVQSADGTTTDLDLSVCQNLTIDGRVVSAESVQEAFLGALDQQRGRLDYTSPAGTPDCHASATVAPARPGREHLVSAVLCSGPSGSDHAVTLDADQLATLDQQWRSATAPAARGGNDAACTQFKDPPRNIRAVTDRGDVVTLDASPCGFLIDQTPWPAVSGYRVPLAIDDL